MDITRNITDPTKRYEDVVVQQGKSLTDDDLNDAYRIHAEARRVRMLELVGPHGTPDDGFAISSPGTAGGLDFTIGAGTYYAGGLRVEAASASRYSAQPDWPFAVRPAALGTYLAFLELSEQDVSPFEDAELFEAAMGGVDTSGRRRLMWRVRLANIGPVGSCEEARARLAAVLAAAGEGTLRPDGELVVDTRLRVTFNPAPGADLCSPTVAGWAEAENQLVRVQLAGANTLTWGFDNACPITRVTVDASRTRLTLATPPRDDHHHPRRGQVVEVLPQTGVLANGEPVAARTGFLTTVASPYQLSSGELTLAAAVPGWMPAQLFMRVWNRGDDVASPAAVNFTPGTALALGNTGLSVTITGNDRAAGDHWLLAVRTGTPDIVVPWRLTQPNGSPPHGVRRFIAPLARLRWIGGAAVSVFDCRVPFTPLTEPDCCSVHVDPRNWLTTIARLRANSSLREISICFAPGDYELPASASIVFGNLRAVRLYGQGRGTVIRARDRERVFGFERCEHVEVESLSLLVAGQASSAQRGRVRNVRGLVDVRACRTVRVRDVLARTLAAPRPAMACVAVRGLYNREAPGADVIVEECLLVPGANQVGVLALETERLVVRNNVIGRIAQHRTKQGSLRQLLGDPGYRRRMARLLFRQPRELAAGTAARPGEAVATAGQGRLAFRSIAGLGPQVGTFLRNRAGNPLDLANAAYSLLASPYGRGGPTFMRRLRDLVLRNRPPAAAYGVVAAGRRADSVRVEGNDISDVRSGVVVALSHGTNPPYTAGRVNVENNLIWLLVTLEGLGLPHRGVQVGHARTVDVRGNEIRTDHKGYTGELLIPTEGVRLWGRFGARRFVGENLFSRLRVGVRFRNAATPPGTVSRAHNTYEDVDTRVVQ